MYGGLGSGYGMGISPYGTMGLGMNTMGMGMYGRSPMMGGMMSPYGGAYGSPYGMMGRGAMMGGAMLGGGMLGGMGAMGHASDPYTSAYFRGGSAVMPMMM